MQGKSGNAGAQRGRGGGGGGGVLQGQCRVSLVMQELREVEGGGGGVLQGQYRVSLGLRSEAGGTTQESVLQSADMTFSRRLNFIPIPI